MSIGPDLKRAKLCQISHIFAHFGLFLTLPRLSGVHVGSRYPPGVSRLKIAKKNTKMSIILVNLPVPVKWGRWFRPMDRKKGMYDFSVVCPPHLLKRQDLALFWILTVRSSQQTILNPTGFVVSTHAPEKCLYGFSVVCPPRLLKR